jgi:hypothetical protein
MGGIIWTEPREKKNANSQETFVLESVCLRYQCLSWVWGGWQGREGIYLAYHLNRSHSFLYSFTGKRLKLSGTWCLRCVTASRLTCKTPRVMAHTGNYSCWLRNGQFLWSLVWSLGRCLTGGQTSSSRTWLWPCWLQNFSSAKLRVQMRPRANERTRFSGDAGWQCSLCSSELC